MSNEQDNTPKPPKPVKTWKIDGVEWERYEMPSGVTIEIQSPTIKHLDIFEDITQTYPNKPIRQLLKALEAFGVDNTAALKPADLKTLSDIIESFFSTDQAGTES